MSELKQIAYYCLQHSTMDHIYEIFLFLEVRDLYRVSQTCKVYCAVAIYVLEEKICADIRLTYDCSRREIALDPLQSMRLSSQSRRLFKKTLLTPIDRRIEESLWCTTLSLKIEGKRRAGNTTAMMWMTSSILTLSSHFKICIVVSGLRAAHRVEDEIDSMMSQIDPSYIKDKDCNRLKIVRTFDIESYKWVNERGGGHPSELFGAIPPDFIFIDNGVVNLEKERLDIWLRSGIRVYWFVDSHIRFSDTGILFRDELIGISPMLDVGCQTLVFDGLVNVTHSERIVVKGELRSCIIKFLEKEFENGKPIQSMKTLTFRAFTSMKE